MDSLIALLPVFLASYLIGSLPFGLILTKLAGLGDIRAVGSGNIGATNVLRTGKKGLALATLLLDGGKGFVAVWAALGTHNEKWVAAALLGVVIGHIFPVWLKFKGGKGVATALGAFLALGLPGYLACAAWLLTAILGRRSSLAALVAMVAGSLGTTLVFLWLALFLGRPEPMTSWTASLGEFLALLTPLYLVAALVIWRHKDNIKRLLNGTEPKIGQKG